MAGIQHGNYLVGLPKQPLCSGTSSVFISLSLTLKELSMTDAFKVGDKVQWHSPQGTVDGTIKKKLTAHATIKKHEIAASQENPEYLVVSDKTGVEAAHKATALKKL